MSENNWKCPKYEPRGIRGQEPNTPANNIFAPWQRLTINPSQRQKLESTAEAKQIKRFHGGKELALPKLNESKRERITQTVAVWDREKTIKALLLNEVVTIKEKQNPQLQLP